MSALIIYHANCPDGWTAAWIAARALSLDQDALYPGIHGESPPAEARGKSVYIVDFSYSREDVLQLRNDANSLVILDHHVTAQAALADIPGAIFDMHESGASLAWDYFHKGERRPWLVQYMRDRDLWLNELQHSQEVAHAVMAEPYTLAAWDMLASTPLKDVQARGVHIRRHVDKYVAMIAEQRFMVTLDGVTMPAVNAPFQNVSDVLHSLVQHSDSGVALAFWWTGTQWSYSIRSGERDITDIAQKRGGGGHALASGFKSNQLLPELLQAMT